MRLPKMLSILSVCMCLQSLSVAAEELVWRDPLQLPDWGVEGQAWPDETSGLARLPARAQTLVRPGIWSLSRASAGLSVRFYTDSPEIHVRYSWEGRGTGAMAHMPATGASGLDLFARDSNGNWQWLAGPRRPNHEDIVSYMGIQQADFHGGKREYMLMLSPYVRLDQLQIGLPEAQQFEPIVPARHKPVVVWGTSIVQGACASRPGMMWTNRLRLELNIPIVNLGFSGSCHLDAAMVDLVNEIDARAFIIDSLPNMVHFSDEEIATRMLHAVRSLREGHPGAPIVLVEHAGQGEFATQPAQQQRALQANAVLQEVYTQLTKEGFAQLFTVTQADIGLLEDVFGTVDGIHPNDIGMQRQADAVEAVLRDALRMPEPVFPTTDAVPQSRERYTWHTRHQQCVEAARELQPRLVMMGDSIIHYWGGEPESHIVRGNDSWEEHLTPRQAINLGFGWDKLENGLWRVRNGELSGYEAEQIVLLLGTNNLGDTSDEAMLAGYAQLFAEIKRAQPSAELLVMGLLPRAFGEERIVTLNAQVAELAADSGVSWADIGHVFLTDEGVTNRELMPDGLHPNAAGYAAMAAALLPHLIEMHAAE